MTNLTLDSLNEEEFRRSIEMRLRHDLAGAAIDRLRALIAPYAAPGGILPARFLTVNAADLNLYGWDGLGDALRRHDRPGRPVTALSIAFGWPGDEAPVPDAEGRLNPFIETAFFTDDSFPFSVSGREDLLDGYSYHGCTWADDFEARESIVSLGGADDLHGALALIEARLLASEEPDDEEIRAGSLGACLLSVLLHQAVAQRIASDGLPRPLCVMAGSNGVYPYFDAPVVGMSEEARRASEAAEEEEVIDRGVPGPRYSSLLVAGIPRAKKRAVLVLEETREDQAVRIAALRGNQINERAPVIPPSLPQVAAAEDPQSVQRDPETTIVPVAGGPLLTKKQPSASAWDFRDMLGTPPESAAIPQDDNTPADRSPSAAPPADQPPHTGGPEDPPVPPGEPSPDEPEDPFEDSPPLAGLPEPEDLPASATAAVPMPRPRFPSQTLVNAGFTLMEPSLQDRLELLLTPQSPAPTPLVTQPQPAPTETPDAAPYPAPPAETAWPFGIAWLEEEAQFAQGQADLAVDVPPPRASLWTRALDWLLRR